MKASADFSSVLKLHEKFIAMPKMIRKVLDEKMDLFGAALLAAVIRNASGRPGPNIVSGEYVSLMRLEKKGFERKVTNSSPQTHRLEYGYVGTDRAGRLYNQPPYPHFRPALIEVKPMFIRALISAPKEAWKRL